MGVWRLLVGVVLGIGAFHHVEPCLHRYITSPFPLDLSVIYEALSREKASEFCLEEVGGFAGAEISPYITKR